PWLIPWHLFPSCRERFGTVLAPFISSGCRVAPGCREGNLRTGARLSAQLRASIASCASLSVRTRHYVVSSTRVDFSDRLEATRTCVVSGEHAKVSNVEKIIECGAQSRPHMDRIVAS